MSDVVGLLKHRFFIYVKHFHVFKGLFEKLDSVFVIRINFIWLCKHVGVSNVKIRFVFTHLNFLFWACMTRPLFLILTHISKTLWTFIFDKRTTILSILRWFDLLCIIWFIWHGISSLDWRTFRPHIYFIILRLHLQILFWNVLNKLFEMLLLFLVHYLFQHSLPFLIDLWH